MFSGSVSAWKLRAPASVLSLVRESFPSVPGLPTVTPALSRYASKSSNSAGVIQLVSPNSEPGAYASSPTR